MRPSEIYDEQRVLHLLAEGNEYAFTQVFDHYRDKVYSIAIQYLKSPILAEEIVQDLFLKVWIKRAEMKEMRNLKDYLFIMARNMIFDRIKKIAFEVSLQKKYSDIFAGNQQVNDTEHRVEHRMYQEMLNKAIDTLSPQQKQVYTMAKIQGLSHKEIAENLNISVLTVKTHLSRAMDSIRQYLGKDLNVVYIGLLLTALNSN